MISGQLQVKIELDPLLLKIREFGSKLARFLHRHNKTEFQDYSRVKYSTVVSGTTPSGCTERAPTGSHSAKISLTRAQEKHKEEKFYYQTMADYQQSTTVLETTPSGCTERAPTCSHSARSA